MLQFSSLRLNGFKSFVDRTEIDISPGLNGVVGPNGCGKSNLVEALRWVMGENSAKRMRGGGMEDVIFNGTSARTARNIAEVSLLLDNSSRTAPPAYNGEDNLEVTRRIERDHGSTYKINGKVVRARDVQMLFADTVTGANSPALVSQGRVTSIINAKPQGRRLILEESAGISGLYARRHEAELRLKAADNNLIRVEDILGSMESRLNALKRQVRQAARYRNISAQIRQLDLLIAWLDWQKLAERTEETQSAFKTAESEVASRLTIVSQLGTSQSEMMQTIPALRKDEADAAARLQTRKVALQRLEDESARLEAQSRETQDQLAQTRADLEHEEKTLSDSDALLIKLEEEHKALLTEQTNEGADLEQKQVLRDELETKVLKLEEHYNSVMESSAEKRARLNSLENQIEQNEKRLQSAQERKTHAINSLKDLEGKSDADDKINSLSGEIDNLEKRAAGYNKDLEDLSGQIEKRRLEIQGAKDTLSDAENKKAELLTEISMLHEFLQTGNTTDGETLLDVIEPDDGYESALSRALGEALLAVPEEDAPRRWIRSAVDTSDLPPLPEGTVSIARHIKAPAHLSAALSQIGLVEDKDATKTLLGALKPGQALVSRAGDLWRWDGYCLSAVVPDQNAQRLARQKKLAGLEKKQPELEKVIDDAARLIKDLQANLQSAESRHKEKQAELKDIYSELTRKRQDLESLRESDTVRRTEINRQEQIRDLALEDIATLKDVIAWDTDRLEKLKTSMDGEQEQNIDDLRQSLLEARKAHQDAIRAFDLQQQAQNTRNARIHAISDERINIQNRAIRARERIRDLTGRQTVLTTKIEELQGKPEELTAQKEEILSIISQLEEERNKAAESLAARESELQEIQTSLRKAENKLSESREARARAEATLSGLAEQKENLKREIAESFDLSPEGLRDNLTLDLDNLPKSPEQYREERDTLYRDRESIGPVNLRAEEELKTLEQEVGGMLHERNDLIQAIDELRSGIQKINREARERLLAAFEHVNAHFQGLFVRLFGGGKAHLALIESDDPLGAGLEIYAQPPGKTLQSLSLLSGGEQTLASIALIFAMFLTNPSPICVLDEIDAPLDDANVDKVCDLLEEIAERGDTRFLIITHHRLTMARMDKLYGVTMGEQGVSQLVSVDLQQSFDFLEEAA